MSLLITISKAPESVALAESSKTFDMQGGTMGRGKNNTWVLEDPERFLSTTHCQFSSENGQFYISDLSTNGTFFNGSDHPMGKGTKLPLNDGDTFILGDYEFSVSLWSPSQDAAPQIDAPVDAPDPGPFSNSPLMGDDPFSAPSGADGDLAEFGGGNPFGGGHVSSADSIFNTSPEETDPLAALDKAQGGSSAQDDSYMGGFDGLGGQAQQGGYGASDNLFQSSPASDPFAGPTHSDQADPLNQQVSWPGTVADQSPFSGASIPDDWDNDLLSNAQSGAPAPVPPPVQPSASPEPPVVPKPARAPAPPSASQAINPRAQQAKLQNTGQFDTSGVEISPAQQQVLEKANAKIQAELEILKRRVSAQQRGIKAEITVDTGLINAMGFQEHNLVDEEITQINKLVGEVVREMTSGLMKVLGSRSAIKNEFRMNVTTIQPVENNPLKFSANVDDALENMFIKQGNAYKKPVEAVREGFEGIAEHQVAILAGMRAAFKGVIERFDPVLLEARFARQKKGSLIPGSQKAKNWDLYLEYFNEQAGDIDNSFQYLFGDEFVNAYEDQLQKLAFARKTQNSKK